MAQEKKMKGFIVRDCYGLALFRTRPYYVIGEHLSHWTDELGPNSEWRIPDSLFPDLKETDDPIEVEITFKPVQK